jgi:hypothetical protein
VSADNVPRKLVEVETLTLVALAGAALGAMVVFAPKATEVFG